ncbi:MAG: ABC transporter permease [Anaerolineales bacterium]
MRILQLALKDMKQLFQSWQTAFFLLLMPIGFTLLFGFMFSGNGGGEEDTRLLIGVMDLDQTEQSQAFIQMLEGSETLRPVVNADYTEETYRKQVEIGDLNAALVLPSGFGESLATGELLPLTVVADDTALVANQAIRAEVETMYARLFGMTLTASISQETYRQIADLSTDEQQAFYQESLDLAAAEWKNPPATVFSSYAGAETEEQVEAIEQNAYIHSSPGMMAQFAIAGLIGAAEILVTERKSRALSRMLTTGFSRMGILTGHYLAMSMVIFLQLLVLAVFGQIFLDLKYFSSPVATLLLITASAMVNGALGLLIGALAKSSDTAVVFSLIPMFIFAGLGGAWMPLEFAGKSVQFVAHFTPVAWMMDGFKDILARGAGLETVWLPIVVLLGFAALFFSLGAWRFRFE